MARGIESLFEVGGSSLDHPDICLTAREEWEVEMAKREMRADDYLTMREIIARMDRELWVMRIIGWSSLLLLFGLCVWSLARPDAFTPVAAIREITALLRGQG